MRRIVLVSAVMICGSLFAGCSRKPAQTAPPPPEVLVTTVTPQDVPRVLERVATLDGFINANINAQVQGYIISRDYQEGSVVKKGDLLFQIDPRPFEAALAQAKGTLAKDKANQVKAEADEKRAFDLFKKKVISDQERDTAIAAAGSSRANVEADQAAVQQAEINLSYTKSQRRSTASLGSRTVRLATWSGQLRDHSQQFHSLIRLKPLSAPAKARSQILSRAIQIRLSATPT